MRVAVIYRPRDPAPLDAAPVLFAGLERWLEDNAKRFSTLEFFIGGGGMGILELDNSTELHRIVAENPLTGFCEVEVRPLVTPSAAMDNTRAVLAARQARGG